MACFFTYIVASRRNGALYTGSTDNLLKRVNEHRNGRFDGFTSKYGVSILVWFERHDTRHAAYANVASRSGGGSGSWS